MKLLVVEDQEHLERMVLITDGFDVETASGGRPACGLLHVACCMMGTSTSSPASHSLPLRGLTVLLIEDEAGPRGRTQRLLEEDGAYVAVVANGTAALHVMEAVSPDVVLYDVNMPVIDAEFLRRLRADARYAPFAPIPVVALTVAGGSTSYLRTLAANFDGYLLKPVGAVTLMAVVDHLSRRSKRRAAQSSPSAHGTRDPSAGNLRHAA